jgi:hypothetical protein
MSPPDIQKHNNFFLASDYGKVKKFKTHQVSLLNEPSKLTLV